jgi:hypothetical protein
VITFDGGLMAVSYGEPVTDRLGRYYGVDQIAKLISQVPCKV